MLEIVNILYELYLIKHNIFNIKSIYGPKPKLRIEGMHDRGASSYPPPHLPPTICMGWRAQGRIQK